MKKILLLAFGLICYSNIFASQPLITCPTTLTCNYDAGTCNLPTGQWILSSGMAQESFSGSKTINLSYISGGITTANKSTLACSYDYKKNSTVTIWMFVKKLTGVNWIFSGWGMKNANCHSIIDPDTCAGE